MKVLAGKPVADTLQRQLESQLGQLSASLVIIVVGHNPASQTYIKHKQKAGNRLGITVTVDQLEESIDTQALIQRIQQHNQSQASGIIIQLPLPPHLDTAQILASINPLKDVDGLTPTNLGYLVTGQPTLVPATAMGIMELLKHYQVELEGKHVVVVGRSRLVGQPIAQLLLQANASVTITHSRSSSLAHLTQAADIIIAAAGQYGLITRDMVKKGAVVIDVGLTGTPQGLKGDVDPDVGHVASAMTPVPGGVGPLTVMCLMQNVVKAAKQQAGLEP